MNMLDTLVDNYKNQQPTASTLSGGPGDVRSDYVEILFGPNRTSTQDINIDGTTYTVSLHPTVNPNGTAVFLKGDLPRDEATIATVAEALGNRYLKSGQAEFVAMPLEDIGDGEYFTPNILINGTGSFAEQAIGDLRTSNNEYLRQEQETITTTAARPDNRSEYNNLIIGEIVYYGVLSALIISTLLYTFFHRKS